MTISVNVAHEGEFKEPSEMWVSYGGQWVPVSDVWVSKDGEWVGNSQTSVTTTTTSLSAQPTSVMTGETVTLTATVTADAGDVQFKKDGVALGAPVAVDASGVAVATDVPSMVGAPTYTAEYLGTASWGPSASSGIPVNVATPFTGELLWPGRPTDWLALPTDTAIRILLQFNPADPAAEGERWLNFSLEGDGHIDWGDGTVDDWASGVEAKHVYSSDAFAENPLTSDGLRQGFVTITPQPGSQIIALLNPYTSYAFIVEIANTVPDMVELMTMIYELVHIVSVPINHRWQAQYMFSGMMVGRAVSGEWAFEPGPFDSIFGWCTEMEFVGRIDFSNGTSFVDAFAQCAKLTQALVFGAKYSISVAGTAMEADALNTFLGNLGTADNSGGQQTVDITGTPGAATCDRTLATAKGWMVTG